MTEECNTKPRYIKCYCKHCKKSVLTLVYSDDEPAECQNCNQLRNGPSNQERLAELESRMETVDRRLQKHMETNQVILNG